MTLNQLCCPAIVVFLILAVPVLCACAMAGRASDNANETWRELRKE